MTQMKNELSVYGAWETTAALLNIFGKETRNASSSLARSATYLFLLLSLILHLFPVPQFFDIFHL